MDAEQRMELAALERAVALLGAVAPGIPRIVASPVCADLVHRVEQARQCAYDDMNRRAGGRGYSARKRALRRCVVRDHIAPILAIAAAYHGDLPYFANLKPPSARLTDFQFLLECKAALNASEHHECELTRLGLVEGFCDALRADIAALGAAMAGIEDTRITGAGLRIRLRGELRLAWKLARAVSRMIDAQAAMSPDDSLGDGDDSLRHVAHAWHAAVLHAPRPAHRLVAAIRARNNAALALRGDVEAAPTGHPAGHPRRALGRIFARVRLALPGGHA